MRCVSLFEQRRRPLPPSVRATFQTGPKREASIEIDVALGLRDDHTKVEQEQAAGLDRAGPGGSSRIHIV